MQWEKGVHHCIQKTDACKIHVHSISSACFTVQKYLQLQIYYDCITRKIIYGFLHLYDWDIVRNSWLHVKHIFSQSKNIFPNRDVI